MLPLVGPGAETPLSSFEVRHLGGALARDARRGGAQSKIDANFVTFTAGLTPTPEQQDIVRAHTQALEDALIPWRAGYDYYNFAETPIEADAVLPPDAYRRLREIKANYDPDQVIISGHPVRPAGI